MEANKTLIDKNVDQCNTDNTGLGSDFTIKLFNYDSRPKKRKFSMEYNSCSESSSMSGPSSPWELRRLKADIIENETKIIGLKKELENRSTNYVHMEMMYKGKVNDLQTKLDKSTEKIENLDKHLKYYRKREAALNNEATKVRNKCMTDRQAYDESLNDLQKSNMFLEGKCRQIKHKLGGEIASTRHQYKDLEKNHCLATERCDELQKTNNALQGKIQQNAEIIEQFNIQHKELEAALRKISSLEDEIISFGEWKALYKTFEKRMATLPDMEKKYRILQNRNKELHKCIGNKLLLEEEVAHLKTCLAKSDQISDEIIALNTKIPYIEQDLAAFKAIAIDHCTQNAPTPTHLRARIEEIMKKDLILVSEIASIKAQKDAFERQIDELKRLVATLSNTTNDLQNNSKDYEENSSKMHKKLRLVVTERDLYKRLIANYENNVTT